MHRKAAHPPILHAITLETSSLSEGLAEIDILFASSPGLSCWWCFSSSTADTATYVRRCCAPQDLAPRPLVQVTDVRQNGLAARHGLEVRDLIVALDGKHLLSCSESRCCTPLTLARCIGAYGAARQWHPQQRLHHAPCEVDKHCVHHAI